MDREYMAALSSTATEHAVQTGLQEGSTSPDVGSSEQIDVTF